ncbi:hypothetical protein [Ornithinimicrobium sp. W1665]
MLLIQVVGLYSDSAPGPDGPAGSDKVGHLLAFAGPVALARVLGARWLVPVLLVHALVAEPLQAWVAPSRMMDPWDTVANLAGVGLGVVVARGAGRTWAKMEG